jgi:uncharacterized protein (TIGR00645 family)
VKSIAHVIFVSRWLQLPLYLGLIVAQFVYVWRFLCELGRLVFRTFGPGAPVNETYVMLTVLGLVDIVMIANLLLMVVVGGYEIFVGRLHLEHHPDRPVWLAHINANVLKLKLAMAIVGITSVHLLQSFIEETDDWRRLMWTVIIHMAFVVSALVLAVIIHLDAAEHRSHR